MLSEHLAIFLESLLLALTISLDIFVCSFAYGTNKVKIPVIWIIMISSVSTGILAASLFFGSLLSGIIPEGITHIICFTVLFILGMIQLTRSITESYAKKHPDYLKNALFSRFPLNLILNSKAKTKDAEKTSTKTMSFSEAFSLSIALSLDCLAVGIGTGIGNHNATQIIISTFVIGILALVTGHFFGTKIAGKFRFSLSWLSGAILIILAFLKMN